MQRCTEYPLIVMASQIPGETSDCSVTSARRAGEKPAGAGTVVWREYKKIKMGREEKLVESGSRKGRRERERGI